MAAKFQLACFERLGVAGAQVLIELLRYATEAGLLVIIDGKRGDIDISAAAYGQALFAGFQTPFGWVDGMHADAATVNPYIGRDGLVPLREAARAASGGLFVLVRTSNRDAGQLQDLCTVESSGTTRAGLAAPPAGSRARAVWERVAEIVAELGAGCLGGSGLSDVGAVLGATVPAHLRRARELMPASIFLMPGIGAQGGRIEDLAPAFEPGRAGGLITASRSIAEAHRHAGGEPGDAARSEAERLRTIAWSLAD